MKKMVTVTIMALAIVALWRGTATAAQFDTIRLTNKTTIQGQIKSMSPTVVVIESKGLARDCPVNEIVSIYFEDEPTQLTSARKQCDSGDYQQALANLGRIDAAKLTKAYVREDVLFYRAYAKAQLALGGSEDLRAAEEEMRNFVEKYRNNFHWLPANELLGQLCVAGGKYQEAVQYFAEVAKAPWDDYKLRAGVALGRALLAQGKFAEARKKFEELLVLKVEGELAQLQRMHALLGKARCQADSGNASEVEEAIKTVEGIIAKTDPEQTELLSHAYNTLGNALRAAKRQKEAMIAFLHVDLLYSTVPDAHAEALFNLVQLWKAEGKPERELQARRLLEQRYANSPWAKKEK
jgi:TolA-binding protein